MKTLPDFDHDVLALIRGVDPMLDPRVQADAGLSAEAALRLLAPQLDNPTRPLPKRRRRRGAVRLVLLAVASGTAAFAVANVLPSGTDSAVPTAQAEAMIVRARTALIDPPGAIVEEDSVTTFTAADDTTSTSEVHQWTSTTAPYDTRQVMIEEGNVRYESWVINGRPDLYDPATNTVYVAPAHVLAPGNRNVSTTRAEIRSLLNGNVCPDGSCPDTNITVNPNATVNGKPAIEFTFLNGEYSYWVSPSNYQPLQFEDRNAVSPDGASGVALGRYPIERLLTGAAASQSLVSLDAQHPDATIDKSPCDYWAFVQRVIPNAGPPTGDSCTHG
jgi:hypothetical protein